MSDTKDIQSALRAIVTKHRLLSHEFLVYPQERAEGSIRTWANQQYFMSVSLSQCFAALYARSPIFEWRDRLPPLTLAIEEAWGGIPNNHGSSFLKFYESTGGCVSDLDRIDPSPETIAAAEGRLKLCRGELGYDLAASTLALAYANEYANLFLFKKLHRLVRAVLGEKFEPTYFNAHVSDEGYHSQALLEFALRSRTPSFELEAAMAATEYLLNLRAIFFDGVLHLAGSKAVELVSTGAAVEPIG